MALAADAAIWALLYIYSSPESTRADYPPLSSAALLAPGIGLFLIIGLSLIYRTVLKRKPITVFETIETMIAFLLAACSVIYFGPPASAMVLGIFCVVLSGAGYAGAFVYFDQSKERRNYLVFASWSAALSSGRHAVVRSAGVAGGMAERGGDFGFHCECAAAAVCAGNSRNGVSSGGGRDFRIAE